MKIGQTIQCPVDTKSGAVDVLVNVVVTGPRDGAAAVLTDLAAHVMAAGRLGGAGVLSPPVQLHEPAYFASVDYGELAACDDGMPGDSRE